eukprot:gnl/TRDRNA2_/TRDRNA2_194590_c0_seq1.p1 gnl/TRDRNA2_/TRDRNA2_194590_c0~~gnl/TRDRNA2_/TRDRNA2_194590_c0_seq1.p1  ORF type:complete len:345 (+),score=44.37 gnl/TRDRNA2_/TRDRNA2_194590_c0_seq1:89-1123(+)
MGNQAPGSLDGVECEQPALVVGDLVHPEPGEVAGSSSPLHPPVPPREGSRPTQPATGFSSAACARRPPGPKCELKEAGANGVVLTKYQAALQACAQDARDLERHRGELISGAAETARQALGPSCSLVKLTSVEGRFVMVFDDVLPVEHVQAHYRMLETSCFRRTEFARPDTRNFRHHILEFDLDRIRSSTIVTTVDSLVQTCFPPAPGERPLEMYRAYTNSVMCGDVAFVHRDSCDESHVTALLYPNPEWAPELGGETVFYSEDGEIVEAVEPRCGRLVLFHGCIQHKGSPPTRLFFGSRYTTAFKFSPEERRKKKSGSECEETAVIGLQEAEPRLLPGITVDA